jgi:uncharacterized protein YggE
MPIGPLARLGFRGATASGESGHVRLWPDNPKEGIVMRHSAVAAAALACIATLVLAAGASAASGQQISVNGTGAADVPSGASNAQQQAAYDRALSAAITDAQTKAGALAKQLALTLGPVQTVTELSNDFLGYCGIGFVSAPGASGVSVGASTPAAAAPSSQLRPIPAKHRKHRSKRKAHKTQAAESACQVQADVTLLYAAG